MPRRASFLFLVPFLLAGLGHGQTPRITTESLESSGIYEWYEDGRKLEHTFEFWDLSCEVPLSKASCLLKVTSFAWVNSTTHIFQWVHASTGVAEIKPGVFKIEMTGRLSPCSGLELIARLDENRRVFIELHGSMRAGTKCQSIIQLKPDFENFGREIPPIWNPLYGTQPRED